MSAGPQENPTSVSSQSRHHYRGRRRGRIQEPPAPFDLSPLDHDHPSPAAAPLRIRNTPAAISTVQDASILQPRERSEQSSRRGIFGRSGRRSGVSHAQAIPRRAFGVQITSGPPLNIASASPVSLQPDAPVFTPNQPSSLHDDMARKGPRTRRMSKSAAPDISTRIHEDIANKLYECAICTSEVLRNSKIWSCKTCWTVFHLSCITKWSKNEGSALAQQRQQDGGMPLPRQWRCPGCNLPKDDLPGAYTCWCAKETDPKPIHGLCPHSCGQTCGKTRASRQILGQNCPHPCELQCHAGPCPPCRRNGPVQPCYCGKDQVAKRCVDTDYDGGSWSCGRVCEDLMPCGDHKCTRQCHEGLCGSCDVPVDSRCYCGKVIQEVACCDRGDERESQLPHGVRLSVKATTTEPDAEEVAADDEVIAFGEYLGTWIGSFECENLCERSFDCGKHSCLKVCHEQTAKSAHCPLSPDVVTHCPCGETILSELNCERTSCDELVPHCEKTCGKILPCVHLCPQKCHVGACKPCLATSAIKCRCGRTSSTTMCHQGMEKAPQCTRTCKALFNCGRHECTERCCPAEKVASDRQAARRKMRSMTASRALENDFEAEHICTRTCGRPLKCGNNEHACQELCHKGPCGTCREAIFDEVSCSCGKTVLQPPLPCGTQPPTCQYPCRRPTACGHPIIAHPCHRDDACPNCPYLVQKACMCGKSILKNQPCWSSQVSCGQHCGRRLKCGIHLCQKSCHREGECEDAGPRTCPHICSQRKTACEHFCLAPCHAPYACKEDKPCQSRLIITCDCGRIKQEVKCLASKASDSDSARKIPECDEECLRLSRNRKLAQALNVDPEHTDSNYIPYSLVTLDMFQNDVKWSQAQERELRVFAADDTEKRLRFKPMKAHQRAFLHALAEDFGFDSESLDPEPHRHIVLFKTPRFVSAPMKTLSQCAKPRVVVPTQATASKLAESPKPYNALILPSPRFALTLDELHMHLHADFETVPTQKFGIAFLPSEEIVIYEQSVLNDTKSIDQFALSRLQALVSKTIKSHELGSGALLCRVDQSLNVLNRENDPAKAGGWNQVVKGVAQKMKSLEVEVGTRSSFTVLRTKVVRDKIKEKKNEKEDIIENWEIAEEAYNI